MPFDSMPTKHDTFSLEGLIAWLETQDPATEYDFTDCAGGCLIGQYLLATTGKMWREHGLSWSDINNRVPFFQNVAIDRPYTHGAALTRARALSQGRA